MTFAGLSGRIDIPNMLLYRTMTPVKRRIAVSAKIYKICFLFILLLTACKIRDIVITAKEMCYCLAAGPSAAFPGPVGKKRRRVLLFQTRTQELNGWNGMHYGCTGPINYSYYSVELFKFA
jgi:hypothetical protein